MGLSAVLVMGPSALTATTSPSHSFSSSTPQTPAAFGRAQRAIIWKMPPTTVSPAPPTACNV